MADALSQLSELSTIQGGAVDKMTALGLVAAVGAANWAVVAGRKSFDNKAADSRDLLELIFSGDVLKYLQIIVYILVVLATAAILLVKRESLSPNVQMACLALIAVGGLNWVVSGGRALFNKKDAAAAPDAFDLVSSKKPFTTFNNLLYLIVGAATVLYAGAMAKMVAKKE